MLLDLTYICPHCAQLIEATADPSQGKSQVYVEDCQVCCRPLTVRVTLSGGDAWADVAPEGE